MYVCVKISRERNGFMKRFAVKILTFLYIFSVILAAFRVSPQAAEKKTVDAVISSIPDSWPEGPEISARAAVLLDADSGEILYAKNATASMYPASTTKLITALITLENCSLTDIVTFSSKAVAIPSGSSHIGMRRGEQMELKECLYGLLLPSANEVANALAEHVSGTIGEFVVKMNERAYQLGAVNTSFVNANGLHEEEHYTCAYDLARIMMACADNSTFVSISSQQSYVHHADDLLPKDIPMTNTHLMLRSGSDYYNEYAVCGKTGHTEESGYNLVTYAEKDNIRLVAVVMGCENGEQYLSTQSLLDYGFNYFTRVLPAELDTSLNMESSFTSSPLGLPTEDGALLSVDSSDSILLPVKATFSDLEKSVEETEDGLLLTYTYDGYPLGTVTLSYVSEEDENPLFKDKDTGLLSEPVENVSMLDGWMLLAIGGMFLVLVLFIIFLIHWIVPKKKLGH